MQDIISSIEAGHRIEKGAWLTLARKANLHELGFLANTIRKRLHPEPFVTYVIDRNINYTDICISACKFCAFFKAPESGQGLSSVKKNWQKNIGNKGLRWHTNSLTGGPAP